MFRRFMDSLTRFVCWAKRNRVVDLPTGIVKVNVGSGLSVSPGWINVDASLNLLFSRLPRFVLRALYSVSGSRQLYSRQQYCDILEKNVFVQHNVEYGLPFPDQSVDFIYSSHLLEHLSPHDARHLLREAHRVLKKGGILRISVPDLERAVSRYEQGDKEELLKALLAASGRGYFVPHRYAYDFDLLRAVLEEAGFANVRRCPYREGQTPDVDVLDIREHSLHVEADKEVEPDT